MWNSQLERLRPALDAWNHGIQRAMDDYATHPTAACSSPGCTFLARNNGQCFEHDRDRRAAAARMKKARGAA